MSNWNHRVFVIDDDESVLSSVNAVLSQHGYQPACFQSAEDFFAAGQLDLPGCVVTDLQMPGITGLQTQRQLLEWGSPLAVVVVTGVADVPTTVTLMEQGAITLLEKPYQPAELLRAIVKAIAISQERWELLQRTRSVQQRLNQLTEDERQVLDHMLAGEPNKLIAVSLDISQRTVDRRRQGVLEKMGVTSIPALALLMGAMQSAKADK